jgi:integrase
LRGNATRLTQSFVNSATSLDKSKARFWDTAVPGLVLVVTHKAAKTYCAVYRGEDGRQREPRIGDARVITLDQARNAAIELLAATRLQGLDPINERRLARQAAIARRALTVGKLFADYFKDGALRRSAARHALEEMYAKKHLLPRFGSTPASDLTTRQLSEALAEIAVSSGSAAANTNLEILRQMLGFATERGLLTTNVARGLRAFPKTSRERVATEAEIRSLVGAFDAANQDGRSDSVAAVGAIEFALLTLQRRGEVAGLHWREIDWQAKIWTIPGPRTKNKKGPHLVPLSQTAMDILKAGFDKRRDGYAFRNREGGALDPHVMTRAFARLTADLAIEDLTVHDLRRTGATLLTSERLGVMGEIVSRILNHTPPGPAVTLVYNRNSYLPQKRAALDAWAKELARMAVDHPARSM